jgi:hypothetical protein
MRKTYKFNKKHHKRKTRKNNKHSKKLKHYGGVPLNRLKLQLDNLETKHEEDGDVAQEDILEALPGLPQNKPNEEHGIGAERRQRWLENNDWESWKENIGIADGKYMVQLPKHIQRRKNPDEFTDEEIKEIILALKPFTKAKTSKRKKMRATRYK